MSTFYICATPIGNLDDISKRLVDTLNSVDIVYAEDTRRGKKLLSHLDIKKPIYSYFVGNEKSKSNEILKQIKEGKSIALISDAGTPLISDPGEYLVKELIKNNVDIFAIPGPSSVLVALTLSGFDTGKFNFLGFVPKSGKDREKFYHQIKNSEVTSVCFTSGFGVAIFFSLLSTSGFFRTDFSGCNLCSFGAPLSSDRYVASNSDLHPHHHGGGSADASG